MLDKLKLHFELMGKDPYKDLETTHIDVKQLGIATTVLVRTPSNKKFRKDKYGYFRLLPTTTRRSKSKSAKAKPAKKVVAHVAHA